MDCLPPNVYVSGECVMVDGYTSRSCLAPFLPVGDQCLYFATFSDSTYDEARQICHSLNGELAIVDTATRLKNIIDYINENGTVQLLKHKPPHIDVDVGRFMVE